MKVNTNDFKVTKSTTSNNQEDQKFYTIIGKQDFLDNEGYPRISSENDIVYAKAIKDKPSKSLTSQEYHYSYYLLITPNKEIYNPQVLYKLQEDNPSFIDKVCKNPYSFKAVTKSIFDKYLTFLKSGSIQWYNSSQRELG